MSKPKRIANKFLPWIDARKKHRLTHMQVQMARELGLNPRRIGGYAGNEKDPDRLSPGEFIEALYFKQFRKAQPDVVQTIEQLAEMHEEKRAERISAKLAQAAPASPDASVDEELVDEELPPLGQTPSQTGSQS
ncbi:MAG TPA: hypothetical protein DDZ51_13605 [Planctomycetaceae bacterium]|nr:hypothetical protein [Planctomycetaceae bacterium]